MAGERRRMAWRFFAFSLWIGGFLGVVGLIIVFLPGLDYFGRLALAGMYVFGSVALMAWSSRREDRLSAESKR